MSTTRYTAPGDAPPCATCQRPAETFIQLRTTAAIHPFCARHTAVELERGGRELPAESLAYEGPACSFQEHAYDEGTELVLCEVGGQRNPDAWVCAFNFTDGPQSVVSTSHYR